MWRGQKLAGCTLNHVPIAIGIRDFYDYEEIHGFMKTIFFIHFHEAEAKEKIKPLKESGYKVDYHFSTETTANLRDNLPDVLIISLDRLPSHGKAYAEWLWEAEKRQHIPIIFCGGKPEKVITVKEKLPNAIYCSNEKLLATLEKIK